MPALLPKAHRCFLVLSVVPALHVRSRSRLPSFEPLLVVPSPSLPVCRALVPLDVPSSSSIVPPSQFRSLPTHDREVVVPALPPNSYRCFLILSIVPASFSLAEPSQADCTFHRLVFHRWCLWW